MISWILCVLLAVAIASLALAEHERQKHLSEIARLKREIDAWKLKDQHSNELIERYT